MTESGSTTPQAPRQVVRTWRTPSVALATGLYVGLFPWAPGTLGTLWGIPLTMLLQQLPSLFLQAVCNAVLIAVGVPLCTRAARHLGRKDPGSVVWDEIVTVPITFFGVAPGLIFDWKILATGFILHRIFDISKCPPARQLERLPDGLGIMADDIAAGIYSCITLHGLLYFQLLPGIVHP